MYEKEKQRENHLIVLLVYTFFSLILTGESLLLGWEVGAIVLLLTALIGSWVIYITDMVSGGMRLWLYFAIVGALMSVVMFAYKRLLARRWE